jgi:serine/threonine protein phosphatase 1
LLPYYETDTHFFVHANADPHLDLIDQPDYTLYWERFNYPVLHQSGKIMVCGHSSQKCGLPVNTQSAICIDTWACGTGWLTCLDVQAGVLWQANQQGETRRLSLDDCP